MQRKNCRKNDRIKTAIVSVSYDGVISHYCGVGTIVHNMSLAINEINQSSNEKYDYFIVSTANNRKCLGYSKFLEKEQKRIVKRNNGKIFFIGKKVDNQFGDIRKWETENKIIVKTISNLSKKYERMIVFLHDAPFIGVAKEGLKNLKNILFVWIPHGTGKLHGKNEFEKKLRVEWEKKNLIQNKQFKIAYISDYMKRHLKEKYGLNDNQLLKLKNGVIFDNFKIKGRNSLERLIPKNKKVILCYGRSEPYKGLSSILKILPYLSKESFVLIIASDKTSHDPNNMQLKRESLKYKNCLVLPKYVPQIKIRELMEKKKLLIVVPSLVEPFGMIPSEARLWGRKNSSIVLVANKGGLKEQIIDGNNGFLIKSLEPKNLAKQINQILSLKDKEKDKIAEEGYKFIKKNYNYVENLRSLLKTVFNR